MFKELFTEAKYEYEKLDKGDAVIFYNEADRDDENNFNHYMIKKIHKEKDAIYYDIVSGPHKILHTHQRNVAKDNGAFA